MIGKTSIRGSAAALAALACLSAAGARAQTTPAAAPAPATSGVKCFVWPAGVEEPKPKEIRLVSRREKDMLYRPADAPEGVSIGLKASEVKHAEFQIEMDEAAVGNRVFARQWKEAAQLILVKYAPTLPFLELPGNDAFDPCMRAGVYLQRAGDFALKAGDTGSVERAAPFHQAAKQIFDSAARAQWNPEWECARLRSILCLIGQNKLEDAVREIKVIQEPAANDLPAGVYWLAHARLRQAQGNVDGALDAAARSVLVETKDLDTFPDALLLSARMYEARGEYHRARDVYYEICRLFQNTDWGAEAGGRLSFIMDKNLAAKKEQADVADVFFGVEEDMNKLVRDFLKSGAPGTVVDEKKPSADDRKPDESKKDEKKDGK